MGLSIDDFTSKDIPAVDRVIKVLKYLNTGNSLEIGSHTIRLAERDDDGFSFLHEVTSWDSKRPDEKRKVWIGYPMTIEFLSRHVMTMDEEEFIIMSANITLNKIK